VPDAQPLLILGTRTLAVEIADTASEIPGIRVAGFVENMERERCAEPLEGLPVIWVDELPKYAGTHRAVCGLATTHRRRFVEQAAAHGITFATLVHPTARVSSKTVVGPGSIVSAGVVVGARTRLGQHVFVNRGALIGHHTEIGDYVTIQPGANVAGACHIGESTFIAMGAVVLDHLTVGARSVIGAGAVVTRDVPGNVQVLGMPAKIAKEGVDGR
jgi:acetyltransferase EpsM